ncbi:MAG TPA: thiol reductant ABC exporter subunit CydC, partial [Verrucomicrobiae bacterium]|nr:thiol reductant ABC exporter subunit CydC [Verrucomicrobiae bacterium]
MRSILRILLVARPQLPRLLAGILLGIGVIAANSALMGVSGWFIASMAAAGAAGIPFNYFLPATAIRLFAILRTVGRYAERLTTHDASFRYLADLRVWLFRRLAPLAPAGLESVTGGELTGRLRADVDSLENLYLRIVAPLVTGAAAAAGGVLFVASSDCTLAAATALFLGTAGVLLPLAGLRLGLRPGREASHLLSRLRTGVHQGLLGKEELAIYGASARHGEEVERLSQALVTEQEKLAAAGALTGAVASLCATGLAVTFLLLGIPSVSDGVLPGPSLVMLLLFGAALFEAAGPMASSLHLLPGAREAAGRITALTEAEPPVGEPDRPLPLPTRYDLTFSGVFPRHPAPPQAGVDLHIAEGSILALTGPSGAGKSTLIELLLRFREYEGSIRLGGAELRLLCPDRLRSLVSAVPQNPHLFNATIRENILLGSPSATQAELLRAVEDAALGAWIATLPQGLETPVGEGGTGVSGGEARRVALARALLKEAPVLLLDEPTEGLDAATEAAVVES